MDLTARVARLAVAKSLARAAGRLLLGHFRNLERYDRKGRYDLVSRADRESEALIARALADAFPGDLRLGEEADGATLAGRRAEVLGAPFAWCIDPLDGTTSFVHGYPFFAVSIGLLAHGRPVLGVVYAPYFDELYAGGDEVPATVDGAPIRVSGTERLADALIGTGFPYDRAQQIDTLTATLGRVLLSARDLRRAGAAALDLCHVAAGHLDGFFEPGLAPWDLAAGEAILRAAGAELSRYDGGPHDLFGRSTVVSNGKIHRELLAALAGP